MQWCVAGVHGALEGLQDTLVSSAADHGTSEGKGWEESVLEPFQY